MFSVSTHTTLMGNRSHKVTTDSQELAHLVYENALNVDLEPDTSNKRGVYVVEFIAADTDARDILQAAGADAKRQGVFLA